MANFTPISAAILCRSRPRRDARCVIGGWRIAFIAGLILAPLSAGWIGYAMPIPQMPASWTVIITAGVLVGFGTRLAGGCTSGHGICGIARFSGRSMTATAVFMLTAIVVVALTRHVFAG
jgi:uncharacterized membrane protein YedE/YeeE